MSRDYVPNMFFVLTLFVALSGQGYYKSVFSLFCFIVIFFVFPYYDFIYVKIIFYYYNLVTYLLYICAIYLYTTNTKCLYCL